jgi:hypothetical protein
MNSSNFKLIETNSYQGSIIQANEPEVEKYAIGIPKDDSKDSFKTVFLFIKSFKIKKLNL